MRRPRPRSPREGPLPRLGSAAGGLRRRDDAMARRWPAGQSAGLAGFDRALQGDRRHSAAFALRRHARTARDSARARGRGEPRGRRARRRGRPPAAHLHLLPSRAVRRCAGRTDVARGVWPDDGGDRECLPDLGADAGSANRPCEEQDSRRRHSLRDTGRCRVARAAGQRAAGDLPGIQRGLRADHGGGRDPS